MSKKKNIDEKLNELKTKKAMAKVENEMEEERKKNERKKLIKGIIISLPTLIVIAACVFLVKYYFDHKMPSDLVKIHEETFMTDLCELLENNQMYIGRPVEIEGYCKKEIVDNKILTMVYRLNPGADGNNGICGLDFKMLDPNEVEDKDKKDGKEKLDKKDKAKKDKKLNKKKAQNNNKGNTRVIHFVVALLYVVSASFNDPVELALENRGNRTERTELEIIAAIGIESNPFEATANSLVPKYLLIKN